MNCTRCNEPLPDPIGMYRDTSEPLCQDCFVTQDGDVSDETWAAGLALLEELAADAPQGGGL